jgi:hypothetical protein
MARDTLAAVEYLDGARRDAGIDLLAEQRVRHRVRMLLNSPFQSKADKFWAMDWHGCPLLGRRTAVKPRSRAAGRRRRRA